MATIWCEKCGGILSSTDAVNVGGCTCPPINPAPDWKGQFPNINEKYSDLLQSHHSLCGEIAQKSAYIQELTDAIEDIRQQRDKTLLQIDALKRLEAVVRYEHEGSCKSPSCGICRELQGLAVKRVDEIKGIKADGTGTTRDRCRRCYPNPGIVMNCAGVHGCYCGCHVQS